MKRKISSLGTCLIAVVFLLTGCDQMKTVGNKQQQQIYFFDQTRNELIAEAIGEELNSLSSPKDKVEYVISRLVENKSIQLAPLQNSTPIPYLKTNLGDNLEDDPTVKFHFTTEYNALTPVEKIGMRASIVYSLAALDFISGVDFYIEDAPLMTATGKTVGSIYPSQIKMEVLDPNPATTPYTLSLYYLGADGKLEKEVRGVVVSDSASVEKLLVEEMIKGPSVDGLVATMPKDTKINEVKVANGTCYIDLSFDIKSKFFITNEQRENMIYSLVNSLTELPQIKKVVVYLDGQSGIAFTDQIDFGDTLERSEKYISKE